MEQKKRVLLVNKNVKYSQEGKKMLEKNENYSVLISLTAGHLHCVRRYCGILLKMVKLDSVFIRKKAWNLIENVKKKGKNKNEHLA